MLRVIEFSLLKRSRALLFLFLIVCASLLLAAETSLVGMASSFDTAAQGRWLLALEPEDPQLQHRLWQVYRDTDPAQSLKHLRLATELSPYSRLYWDHLASACEALGEAPCADRAIERLLKLSPMVPYYHELAAETNLRSNRLDDSLAEFRRLLELDPNYAPSVWNSLRVAAEPDVIFQKMLADPIRERAGSRIEAKVQVSYVNFLSSQADNDAAFRIWKLVSTEHMVGGSEIRPADGDVESVGRRAALLETPLQPLTDDPQRPGATAYRPSSIPAPFPFASAEPYLDRVIGLGRIQEAVTVWGDLERMGIVTRPPQTEKFVPARQPDNLIFNGDFEQFPLNGGFDWRWPYQLTYLAVDFSAPAAYHGAHCLRIDFTVSRNLEYEPAYQIVPVLPNHTYRVEAYVRSEDISSDTGPFLRVSDTQQPGFRDATSDTTVGTTPWHPVRVYFSTGPKTQAVRLSVWRPVGRVFPTEITGSFWLDRVSLECMDSDF